MVPGRPSGSAVSQQAISPEEVAIRSFPPVGAASQRVRSRSPPDGRSTNAGSAGSSFAAGACLRFGARGAGATRPRCACCGPSTVLAVHTATRLLVHHTRINERGYRTALAKLAAALPDPARRYLHDAIADLETLSSEGGRTLDQVAQAWFEGRVLRFDYHAPIGSQKPHRNDLEVYFVEINPANLAPYVIGFERSYFREVRTFALGRIHHPRLLDENYTIPDDFDPRAYLASAWGIVAGPPLEVQLRFRHDVAHRVQERRHRNLRIDHTTDAGDLLVTVTTGQDKNGLPIDLLPWIYAFGPGVEVLAPERVRDHVRRELRDAAAAYGD